MEEPILFKYYHGNRQKCFEISLLHIFISLKSKLFFYILTSVHAIFILFIKMTPVAMVTRSRNSKNGNKVKKQQKTEKLKMILNAVHVNPELRKFQQLFLLKLVNKMRKVLMYTIKTLQFNINVLLLLKLKLRRKYIQKFLLLVKSIATVII